MPVLSKRIVLDCFYLLIFYFEKFSTDVCRLPCAVNVNLNLSIFIMIGKSTSIQSLTRDVGIGSKLQVCEPPPLKGG